MCISNELLRYLRMRIASPSIGLPELNSHFSGAFHRGHLFQATYSLTMGFYTYMYVCVHICTYTYIHALYTLHISVFLYYTFLYVCMYIYYLIYYLKCICFYVSDKSSSALLLLSYNSCQWWTTVHQTKMIPRLWDPLRQGFSCCITLV